MKRRYPSKKKSSSKRLHILIFLAAISVAIATYSVFYSRNSHNASAYSNRPFEMSAGGLQIIPNSQDPLVKFNVPAQNIAAKVDLVYFHAETYGIPWTEFQTSTEPPATHPWTVKMNSFAQQLQSAGKPVYLSLTLSRKKLSPLAENNNGVLKVNDNWASTCFDFTNANTPGTDAYYKKLAYFNYVKWMTTKFNPKYVNSANEINDYWEDCTNKGEPVAEWNALVDVANSAYAGIKSVKSTAIVFPSFTANNVYGYGALDAQCAKPMTNAACNTIVTNHYNNAYAALSGLQRDKFAISAYPYIAKVYDQNGPTSDGKSYMTVAQIPSDYFTRGGDRGGEATVLAETGWNSTNLNVKYTPNSSDTTILTSTPTDQNNYINLMFSKGHTSNIDMIAWWSWADAIPEGYMVISPVFAYAPNYQQCGSDAYCKSINSFREAYAPVPFIGEVVYKSWGSNGIYRFDQVQAKNSFFLWQTEYNLPYTP